MAKYTVRTLKRLNDGKPTVKRQKYILCLYFETIKYFIFKQKHVRNLKCFKYFVLCLEFRKNQKSNSWIKQHHFNVFSYTSY